MKLISKVAAGGTLLASAGVACAGALVIAALERRKRRSGALDGKVVLITGASRGWGWPWQRSLGEEARAWRLRPATLTSWIARRHSCCARILQPAKIFLYSPPIWLSRKTPSS